MIRRIVAIALALGGLVAIALAIASATVWRDSDTVTVSTPADADAPVLVTEPGVLDVVGPDVQITLTAPEGTDIWATIGDTEEIMAWVGDAQRTEVVGLSSWSQLATETAGTEPTVPDPRESDAFATELTGTGTIETEWLDQPGRWTLMAVTDGTAPAPTLTLTWPQAVETPYLLPGLITGGILLLIALALFVWGGRRGEDADEGAVAEPVAAAPADAAAADLAAGVSPTGEYATAPVAGAATADPYAGRVAEPGPDDTIVTRPDDDDAAHTTQAAGASTATGSRAPSDTPTDTPTDAAAEGTDRDRFAPPAERARPTKEND